MGKKSDGKRTKVRKMTEAEYEAYVMSLKEENPPFAYRKYEKEEIGKKDEREK